MAEADPGAGTRGAFETGSDSAPGTVARPGTEPAPAVDARFLTVELICSDAAEHRRRAQQRVSDIKGLDLPGWQEITHRDYVPWPEADLRLDTARLTVTEAARAIVDLGLADGTR